MARAIGAVDVLLGAFTLTLGVFWLANPGELSPGFGVGLVIFGLVPLYSGFSVLRSGRL